MGKKLFDFCIGNPPYQNDVDNKGDRANPLYDVFMDAAYNVSGIVELITPARFLFNAGQTSKVWNEKILNDEHIKVLFYEADSKNIFPLTDIKGGIAITIRNENIRYGAIEVFTPYKELNNIIHRILTGKSLQFIDSIAAPRGNYRTSEDFSKDFPYAVNRLGKGTGNMLVSNFFDKVPEAIVNDKIVIEGQFLSILCRMDGERKKVKIRKDYILPNKFLASYNVASPEANGSGKFGEKLTASEILLPNQGATDTFVSLGMFETIQEAQSLQKYMKTKFFRALLGVKKVTQHCSPAVWKYVPLQDFTASSDIDWSQSIHDIDQQLYKKYGLSPDEIDFIEKNVKEMV